MTTRNALLHVFLLVLFFLVKGSALAQQGGGDTISSIKGTHPHAPAKAIHRPRSAVHPAAPHHMAAARPAARVTPRRVAVRAVRRPSHDKSKPVRFVARSGAGVMASPPTLTGFPMIGMWYEPNYDAADKFGHWASGRDNHSGTPVFGNYSGNDPTVIRSQYQAMRECGVNFVILNDDQTIFAEEGITDRNIRAWFDFMDALPADQRLPLCLSFGGELNSHSDKGAFLEAADYIWKSYAQRPSYFRMSGKPLLLWYIEKDVFPDWSDPRFTVQNCYNAGGAGHEQDAHGGWGWGSYPYPSDNAQCMSFFPGRVVANPAYRDRTFIDRRGGNYYEECWVRVLKARPRYVAVTSWNGWEEQTAIEDSTDWRDQYGLSCPNWYRQITKGYAYLRLHLLLHGFYYKDASRPDVYYCTRHLKLLHVPEYPHLMPTITTPEGWLDRVPKLPWAGKLEPEP
jgi:hypothetical protein